MIFVKAVAFVMLMIGVMVGVGALSSHYPSLTTAAFNWGGWAPLKTSLLYAVGILFAGFVVVSMKK